MKKQLVIIGIVALLVSVGLSGCSSPLQQSTPKDKIIGTWETEKGYKRTFTKDEYIIGNDVIFYTLTDSNFTFWSNGGYYVTYDYSFETDDVLVLTCVAGFDYSTTILYRVK
jgi:hypothetical protein